MKKLFYFSAMALAVSLFIYSCEKEDIKVEDQKTHQKDDSINAKARPDGAGFVNDNKPISTEIWIRRGYEWAIKTWANDCVKGRGLCASGPYNPSPAEIGGVGNPNDNINDSDVYRGKMRRDAEDPSVLVIVFSDRFIADEDELIIDNQFIIDNDVKIGKGLTEALGFGNNSFIKRGNYDIKEDQEGWRSIRAEIRQ